MYTVILYRICKYNRPGGCIKLFITTIELVHVYIQLLLYLEIQQNWYMCSLFADTMVQVHVYSYSLLYLEIQQNWSMYSFYRDNGTGSPIQFLSVFTDTIELVHVLICRYNGTGPCIQLLSIVFTDTIELVHVVIYRDNGTGPPIHLFSIVLTDSIELVHGQLITDTMVQVHVYSSSVLYLHISQNWSLQLFTDTMQVVHAQSGTHHIYLLRHRVKAVSYSKTCSYCYLRINNTVGNSIMRVHCDINASTCNVLSIKGYRFSFSLSCKCA